MRRIWITCMAIGAAEVLGAGPHGAWAQNNSLFGANRRAVERGGEGSGAPAVNGAPGPVNAPARSGGVGILQVSEARATLKADRPEPRPNAVLLGSSPYAVPLPEPEKLKVNDLLTVIVRESKTITSDSKLESNKDWKLDSALSRWITLTSWATIQPEAFENGAPGASFDWKNDYKGDGKYDRRDELTTRVTARIIDVKPNGNLVLEAKDDIRMDDEGYTIVLTGECRAKDVTPQNTVLSTQITDRQIDVQHHGAVRDATRRGWIQRLLDFTRVF